MQHGENFVCRGSIKKLSAALPQDWLSMDQMALEKNHIMNNDHDMKASLHPGEGTIDRTD